MRKDDTEDQRRKFRSKRRSQTVAGFMLIVIGAAAMFVEVPMANHTTQMIAGVAIVGLGGAMIDKAITLDYIEGLIRLIPLAGGKDDDGGEGRRG